MGYDSIRIERDRTKFCVSVTDPEIVKKNRARDKVDGPSDPWQDPNVEYTFDDVPSLLKFIEKAVDIALPADTYVSAFDKLAKEAGGTTDE